MNLSTNVIDVDGIRKVYRSGIFRRRSFTALSGVTLQVPRGTIFGLLGPNGAGKTTLIKILLGIVRKSGGSATVLGCPAGSRLARKQIGYLPENHRIPRHLTGSTALEYYGALSGLTVSDIRRKRDDLLKIVGLHGRERERVSGYSKGMQQRLGLAQAMLHQPELIILDEPTDGVDPVGRKEIRDVLSRLAADGVTIFLNSHLLQEIELICDRVAILTGGLVRRTGSVRELKQTLTDAPLEFQLSGAENTIRSVLGSCDGLQIRQIASGTFECQVRVPRQSDVDQLIDRLRQAEVSIAGIRRRELTLEEAFLEIVGADS